MRTSVILVFGIALMGCAPNVVSNELWAKTVFVPTQSGSQQGCAAGFNQSSEKRIGEKIFRTSRGEVRLTSAPGDVGGFCQLLGILIPNSAGLNEFFTTEAFGEIARKANASVVVFAKIASLSDVSIYLALEDKAGKEFFQVRSYTAEGVIPGVRFNFDQLTPNDVLNIDKAFSFTIVVNRGFGEEKFPITQSNFNPFAINP